MTSPKASNFKPSSHQPYTPISVNENDDMEALHTASDPVDRIVSLTTQ